MAIDLSQFEPASNKNIDPELQEAISRAKDNPRMHIPIKPSKYNLGETRTPYQILVAQANGEIGTPNPGGYIAKGMSLIKPDTPKVDLSQYEPVKYKSEKLDLDNFEPSPTTGVADRILSHIGSAAKGAATDVAGLGLAIADVLAPVGTALGGIAAIGNQGNAEDTIQWWSNELNPSRIAEKLGMPKSEAGEALTEMVIDPAMQGLQKAGRFVGSTAQDLGAPPSIAAAADVATQFALPIGAAKGLKASTLAAEKGLSKFLKEKPVETPDIVDRRVTGEYMPSEKSAAYESRKQSPVYESLDFPPIDKDLIQKGTPGGVPPEPPTSPRAVRVTKRVNDIADLLDTDNIIEAKNEVRELLSDLQERNIRAEGKELQSYVDRVRGPEWVEERLIRALRNNELPKEGIDLARWFIRQNPNVTTDLAIAIVNKIKGREASSGLYSPDSRLIRLSREGENPLTVVHEILHHTERMLPEEMQNVIRDEWIKQLVNRAELAKKEGKPLFSAAISDIFRAMSNDKQAKERLKQAFIQEDIPPDFYQYTSPSEFWAENGSRILKDRAIASQSLVGKVKQWFREFIQKIKSYLGLESDHPVIKGLNEILKTTGEFKSKDLIYKGPEEVSAPPTKKDRRVVDRRTAEEFRKEEIEGKEIVPSEQDIKSAGAIISKTNFLPPRQLQLMLGDKTVGGKISNWAIDQTYEITRKWDRIASEILQGKLREGYGVTTMRFFKRGNEGILKPFLSAARSDQVAVLKMWLDLEKNNKPLLDKGLQWADDAILNKYGLTPEQKAGYKAMTTFLDHLYEITNLSLRRQGRDPIPQIPGYFPHYLKGKYRVHVKDIKTDYLEITSFPSEKAARHFLSEVEKDKNFKVVKDPKTGEYIRGLGENPHIPDWAAEVSLAAQRNMSKGKLNPLLKKRLDQMVSRSSAAFLKSALERSGALKTYIGAEGIRDSFFGSLADSKEVMNVFNQYSQSVFKFAKNAEIEVNVLEPAREFSKNLPNTAKYVNDFLANATDKNPNNFRAVDNVIDAVNTSVGLEKGSIQKLVPITNQILMIKALAGSGKFIAVQGLQPFQAGMTFAPMWAVWMKSQGHNVPGMGSMISAMGRAQKELFISLSPEGKEVMKYMVENHITDSAIWEILQRQLGIQSLTKEAVKKVVDISELRVVIEKVESAGRANVFMQGYFYARKAGFSKQQALDFADKLAVDNLMGNYSKSFRPLMLNNYGVVGQMYSPFATLMNGYLGNMAYIIKSTKDPSLRNYALAAGAAFLISTWLWSGLQGMPGIQEWEAVAKKWNEELPDNPMPSINELMLTGAVPQYMIYGLASQATKYIPGLTNGLNIGESMNAPNIAGRQGIPAVPLFGNIAQATWVGIKAMLGKSTKGEEFKALGGISPPPFRGIIEDKFKESNGMVPIPGDSLKGFMVRESSDWVARYLGGRSLTESTELSKFYLNRRLNARDNDAKELITKQVADAMKNKDQAKIKSLMSDVTKYGGNPKEIEKNAEEMLQGRYQDWRTRERLSIGKGIGGGKKHQRLNELYKQ